VYGSTAALGSKFRQSPRVERPATAGLFTRAGEEEVDSREEADALSGGPTLENAKTSPAA